MVQVINFHEITFLHVIPYSLELSNMQTGRIIQNVSPYRAFKILIFVTNFVNIQAKYCDILCFQENEMIHVKILHISEANYYS